MTTTTTTKEKLLERLAALHLADKASMLQDSRRILAAENAVADAHYRRTLGADYQPPTEDEMGDIHIGDTIHQAPPAPPPPPVILAPVGAPAAAPSSAVGTLGKVAVGAALIAAGAGLPVAASWLLKPSEPPPAAAPNTSTIIIPPAIPPDNDTMFQLRLVE